MPMAFPRRRHHDRSLIPAISAATAFPVAAVLLLLLIASVSFFVPPLLDRHSLPDPNSSNLPKESLDGSPNSAVAESFIVPIGGGSSSRHDIWSSKAAKQYYGCSNASNRFPASERVTRPNRYLMIATSGGLNQQRTGVCF